MQGLVGLKSYTYIEKHWPFLSQHVNLSSNIYNLIKCIDTINDFFYLISFIEFESQMINYDFEAEG